MTISVEQGSRPDVLVGDSGDTAMATESEPRSWKPRKTIDRRNSQDLRYWSERFGVSEEELREAIDTRRRVVKSPLQSSFARLT
jgi:hypothetical protein